jgi:hypothetical protein
VISRFFTSIFRGLGRPQCNTINDRVGLAEGGNRASALPRVCNNGAVMEDELLRPAPAAGAGQPDMPVS